jgi:adenylate cyclase
MRRLRLRSPAKIVILSHLGREGSRVRAEALRLGAVDVIDKPTGAVSRDLRTTRGAIIQQTLRRALGLPALPVRNEVLAPDGALATASILAVDVRGFAALCERVEATALVGLLNEHLALIHDVARHHDGIVDDAGGGALVAFGVPEQRVDHAARAVAAGRELVEAQAARRLTRRDDRTPIVEFGAAIATGLVLAGELGPPGARRYRALGGTTEQAARLGRATQDYGADLVVCGRTLAALATSPATRRLDVVQLEPDGEPITLHEVLFAHSDVDAGALDAYARGMAHYEVGQFARAMKAFDEALRRWPSDRAAARLVSRCRALLGAPSTAWRGAWPLDGGGG